jgi:hypothetical protein|tara:strand:+ start:67 stop:300 length:234 start_codon:yes stop_codon:yes gene_type:complete
MKTLIILLTLIIFSTANAYSKEAVDCKDLKKFSIQYTICKTKAALNGSITNSKKNKANKKSIWKKFGESKSLSDIIK